MISIIIPFHNGGKYIGRCLDSIIENDMKKGNIEIVLIDDCSFDQSIHIIDRYIESYSEISWVKISKGGSEESKKGPSWARNVGISRARGEYLLFVDCDDRIEQELLIKLETIIQKEKPDVICFGVQYLSQTGVVRSRGGFQEEILDGDSACIKILESEHLFAPWVFCIKRSYWVKEKYTFLEGYIHEDIGLLPAVIINATTVFFLNYIGYKYYIHTKSLMHTQNSETLVKKYKDFSIQVKYLSSLLDKSTCKSETRDYINRWLMRVHQNKIKELEEHSVTLDSQSD